MIIDMALYSKIRSMYINEKKSQRAIARELGISRNTVRKYCDGSNVPWNRKEYERPNSVVTEEIIDFIKACLLEDETENLKKQKHTARRIYHRLVEEKGFTGGESTIRRHVKELKQKQENSIMPLAFDPGEAVQIDFGEATVYLDDVKTVVNLFCARLCYSLDIFVMAFMRQNQESFLEAHVNTFQHIGGTPRKMIFDNARVAVKEGFGQYAKPQAQYQALSAHYAFEAVFCNPGKGNEKSLVESLVGWVRRNILVPVPRVKDIDELNELLHKNCIKYREHVVHGRSSSVGSNYQEEKAFLNPLPPYVFDTSKTVHAKVNDYSTVRFDRNNYSVPVKYTGREVTVKGYGNRLSILHRGEEIASYPREYKRDKTFYRLEHYIDLLELKPRSVFNARPVRDNVKKELLDWGRQFPNGPRDMVKLLKLCAHYGTDTILDIKENLPGDVAPSIDLVRSALTPEQKSLSLEQDISVEPVDLAEYDRRYGVAK